jgi:hypothetical protein
MVSGRMTGRLPGQVALFICRVLARLGGGKNAEIQHEKVHSHSKYILVLKLRPGNLDLRKLFLPALEQVLIT